METFNKLFKMHDEEGVSPFPQDVAGFDLIDVLHLSRTTQYFDVF